MRVSEAGYSITVIYLFTSTESVRGTYNVLLWRRVQVFFRLTILYKNHVTNIFSRGILRNLPRPSRTAVQGQPANWGVRSRWTPRVPAAHSPSRRRPWTSSRRTRSSWQVITINMYFGSHSNSFT